MQILKIQILGKSEAALSVFIDTLSYVYPPFPCSKVEIEIIKNIEVEENHLPYRANDFATINEYFHTDYVGKAPNALLGVWSPAAKESVYEFFKDRVDKFINLIHPTAVLPRKYEFGKGINIGPNSTLTPYVSLGDFVTINRQCSIGHHTTIGDFSTINPGVNIAGRCDIGRSVKIGIGANIIDGITIGDNVTIGAGSLVLKNIPDNVTTWGVPTHE